MSNYQIIMDEERLLEFIDWLPELKESECYLLLLFARKKYCPELELRCGHQNMKRVTCNKKELIYRKIKQMEIPFGGYMDLDKSMPQQSLALYITPNPRCMVKASVALLKKLADTITNDYDGYNPQSLALTEIHRAKSRNCFIDFDFDYPNDSSISIDEWINLRVGAIKTFLNKSAFHILRTKGGFHCLVEPNKVEEEFKKSFYNTIKQLGADVVGDNMVPVPGSYVGGFSPYFMEV